MAKKGGKKAPEAAGAKAKAKQKALSAWDDASSVPRCFASSSSARIQASKPMTLTCALRPLHGRGYRRYLRGVQPLLNGILRYYGDVIPDPPPLPPLTQSAFIPLEDQQSRLSLKQRQAISVCRAWR